MSKLSDTLESLLGQAKNEAKELSHGRWTSSRLWTVVGFVAVVLFGAYFALQPDQLKVIAEVVIWFLICTTFSKVAFGFFNAWMWTTARKQAGKDVSAEERQELKNLETKGE